MPTKSRNRNKRAQANRRDSSKRIKRKAGVPERGVPGGIGRTSPIPAPARTACSNLLNPVTKELSAFHVNDPRVFFDEYSHRADTMLGDMRDWLPELYACLKNHPKFEDKKDWKKLPSVNELAEYLFEKVDKLSESGWMFGKNRNGELQLTFFNYLTKYEGCCTMPLEWLELLEKDNEELAELCLCLIAKVSSAWGLDVIFTQWTDMIVSGHLDSFLDLERCGEDEYDTPLVNWYHAYRKGGHVYNFWKDLPRMRNRFSKENLINYIRGFKYESKLELAIYDWLDAGITVLENPSSIGKYINPSEREYNDGEPLSALDIYAFHWSFIDPVYRRSEEWMDDQVNHFGIEAPIVSKICSNTGYKSEGSEDHIAMLDTFMDKGRKMYFDYFHHKLEKHHEEQRQQLLIEVIV